MRLGGRYPSVGRGCRTNPSDQECHDRNMASTCAQSDDSQFAAAWAEGWAITLEQAVEYALAGEADGAHVKGGSRLHCVRSAGALRRTSGTAIDMPPPNPEPGPVLAAPPSFDGRRGRGANQNLA